MSDADEDTAPAETAAAPEGKSKKKKLLIIGGAALLLLGGGGTAAFTLMGGEGEAEAALADAGELDGEEELAEAVFVDVPPMVVNLRSADGQARFLKLHFVLVPSSAEHVPAINERIPLLLDAYQPFLRELRPEDLAGAAAVYRIKEEMLVRALDTLGRDKVRDVLIQDLVQQ